MTGPWPAPSPEAAAFLRDAAQTFLEQPTELVEALDAAIMAAAAEPMRAEPTLAAEVAASTRANLVHWATWTVRDPGARVPVNLAPEVLGIARDAVRRGAEHTLLTTYHAGQNIAWRYVMEIAFAHSSDAAVLHEILDVAARTIFTYVDDTLSALRAQIGREREELTRGTHAERFEVVTLLLEGAPISEERAAARLGYELGRRHAAAIVWSDPGTADHGELARAAEAMARAAGAHRPLTVIASASSLWVWFATDEDPDPPALRAAVAAVPGVRAALGPAAGGVEGFRRSHLDATATQRLMFQMPAELRVASFEDVRVVALAAHDEDRAAEFVARTLGDLAHADPELRHTLRVYIREQFSASRAARALFAHRNTVLNRLHRAEELLPARLEGRGLEIGLALELVHWLGARIGAEPETVPGVAAGP
ncbi:MAG TPA: helix-turn-helix domain-containing protein [Baekduia sp.]|nr:helix-turn-helix domain-containing protein [Baekduia sp.]